MRTDSDSHEVANKFAPTKSHRGQHALRDYRVSIENRTYFITACTHEREPLLLKPGTPEILFECLHALETADRSIEVIASVVMPDHLHFVFRLLGANDLGTIMKRFRGNAAQAVNRALARTGPLWQRGYFDRLLRADDNLADVLHYLWNNPTPPGLHFRCRRDIWDWYRTCIPERPKYAEWLRLNR